MKLNKLLFLITLLVSGVASAQTTATTATQTPATPAETSWLTMDTLFIIGMVVLIVAAIALLSLISIMISLRDVLLRDLAAQKAKEGEAVEVKSFWEEIKAKLWNRAPMEKEEAILMDHDYDGIRELDNYLPPWWKWLFYITIGFAVVYVFNYHILKTAPLQIEEYNAEMKLAAEQVAAHQAELGASIDETNVEVTDDPAALANGEKVFNTNCAICHRPDGGGNIGPNLTDNYWLHGGTIQDIFKTIKFGVPEKGMVSWQSVLRPAEIRDVASYIVTLKGSNPPNPKEPQGELFQEEVKNE